MNCGKCQDRGFIEENHGLIVILCDCEKGKEYRARQEAILGIPEEGSEQIKAIRGIIEQGNEGIAQLKQEAHELGLEVVDDSRTESDNTDTGSPDTSEPTKPRKRKRKRKK